MQKDSQNQNVQPDIIHSGLTHFPTLRQLLTLAFLLILETQGIYICIPLNKNSNMSFLIGQAFLLVVIIYAWYMTLTITPGPMSQLFNQQFIKKSIQQGLKPQQHEQNQHKICTKCQIERAAKIYHCQKCNRCVYKNYFHSQWLGTCISKQNFSQFMAFLIFLEIYLILLEVDNIIHFVQLRSLNDKNLTDFTMDSIQNLISTLFLIIISILILVVISIITVTYFMAFRTRTSIQPLNCSSDCQGLKRASQNDKILYKIRQSIRQSNYFNRFDKQSSQSSNGDIFKQTQNYSAKQLNLKSLKKSFMQDTKNIIKGNKQRQSVCSIEQYQGPFFKTDFFSSAKIFRKKQNSIQRKNRISKMNSLSEQDMINMTSDKWKKYIKAGFQQQYVQKIQNPKQLSLKRNSQLDQIMQGKNSQQNQTPAQLVRKLKPIQNHRGSIMRNSLGLKNRLVSKFSQSSHGSEDKQNQPNLLNPKKIRFIKRVSSNLAQIFQKQSKLQDA